MSNTDNNVQTGDCCVQHTAGYTINPGVDLGFGDAQVDPYDSSCMQPVTRGGARSSRRSARRSA